ncbi:P-loop NTPase [Novosphingobium sp. B 225]|uniref:P-loop NTPase n=1 Tax=Novosphingobium sp. B 225 TaxID=1961849 RepID=UPI000B4AF650|nr:P-loop NTPase [Novosphingobium sp. B 225]
MTEHTKIPVPDDNADAKSTLIERVVRNYDLVKLAPAPIPQELVPPVSKRRRYRRADEVVEEAVVTPVAEAPAAPEPVHAPAAAAPAPAAPVPEVVEPEVIAAPAQVPAVQQPGAAPVVFRGDRHPVRRQHLRDQGLIVPEGSVTALLEEFRIVKRQLLLNASQLRQQGMGLEAQRILICSPHPGEGKSFTSVNLALAIAAEKESEVLLVDADFAKPSVLSMLGLPGGPGLMDALVDPDIDVAQCVIGTDIAGLWVLPAGNATTSDTEYLSSNRTRDVLDRLTQGAPNRIVIFDSPPALAASPAAELAKYVGQAVLVARCDKTGQGSLEDAVSLLSACPNIQLLLNAVHFSPSGRRFGSYYGYGG